MNNIDEKQKVLRKLPKFDFYSGYVSTQNDQPQSVSCTTGCNNCENEIVCGGDIHFSTLDNVRYTFNSAGDYVYLKTTNPKMNLKCMFGKFFRQPEM